MVGSRWTISSVLSVSRIVIAFPLSYCILTPFPEHRWWAAGLLAVGTATDFFDGFYARRRHEVTEWGKIIDPLADKVGIAIIAIALAWQGDLEWWVLAVVLLRDALIVVGGIAIQRRKGIIVQSNWPGKIAVSALAALLLLSIIGVPALHTVRVAILWLSLVMLTLSFILYVQRLFIGRQAA